VVALLNSALAGAPRLTVCWLSASAWRLLICWFALGVARPLDFSVFPTLLLVVTLFRLGLHVATTRLILLARFGRHWRRGHIIQAFGQFTVGGSLIVGSVVFSHLAGGETSWSSPRFLGRVAGGRSPLHLWDAFAWKQMSHRCRPGAGLSSDVPVAGGAAATGIRIEFSAPRSASMDICCQAKASKVSGLRPRPRGQTAVMTTKSPPAR